jgi:fructoselysine-6-P-deglycase FrlB-like protein
MDILAYIYEQPQVVERVFKEIPRDLAVIPKVSPVREIFLVGSGTSMNTLVAVEPLLASSVNSRVRIQGPLSFLSERRREHDRDSLAVILSQSGTSNTTIQAVEHARRLGMRTITVTAERESPIARVSSETLIIPVGPEPVGPKTKGYTAGVLTLLLLILVQADRVIEAPRFPAELSSLIDHCRIACGEMAGTFRGTDFVMVMGQGRHYGTALEGSLKITEMSGTPAAAFETEEAFHGRFHGLSEKSLALFVTASPDQQEMAASGAEVLSRLGVGVHILNLEGQPSSPFDCHMPWPANDLFPELDLLGAIVPFQFLAWHLAREKGIVPEKMRHPGLSQKLGIKTSKPL